MNNFSPRKLILLLSDMLIVLFCTIISSFIIQLFKIDMPDVTSFDIAAYGVLNMLFSIILLALCGSYNILWRYLNYKNYLSCAMGTTIGLILGFLVSHYMKVNTTPQLCILNLFITLLCVCSFRLVFRRTFLVLTDAGKVENRKRVMIIGAGSACHMILSELKSAKSDPQNPSNLYEPICIIDDDTEKIGKNVMGIKIVGSTESIQYICEKEKIELIMFAIPSANEKDRRRIISICNQTGAIVKIIPYLSQIFLENKILNQIKDTKIEDLLGRPPIDFDNESVSNFIRGKVCLVTGGGGSIGSELVRQIITFNPKQIIILDIYENNVYDIQQEIYMEYGYKVDLVTVIASVRDYNKLSKVFENYKPNIVFHAAAHKHVSLMEECPEEAVKNNIVGTFNTAVLADFFRAEKFIMISTDKAVNPTNVMGATKRCCEMIIQYMAQYHPNTQFVTTRFGNVLGSNGSAIPLFRRQIESGKPVTVTHRDIIRYFMTIPEAVQLVLQATAMADGGEIFVLDMGAPVKILTLAENLIKAYGKVPYRDVPIKFIGLRPGEKLYEELLMDEEGLKSTANDKIFVGNQIKIDENEFIEKLAKLKDAANKNDSEKTLKYLEEIVPTFNHSQNLKSVGNKKQSGDKINVS